MDATRWTDGNALSVDEMARKMWEPDPADAAGGGGAIWCSQERRRMSDCVKSETETWT